MSDEKEKVNQEPENQSQPAEEQKPEVEKKEETQQQPAEETAAEKKEEAAETKAEETPAEEKAETPAEKATQEETEETPQTATDKLVKETIERPQEQTVDVKSKETEVAAPKPEKPEDFDWDAVGKKQDGYSKGERDKLEELYNKTFSSIAEHEVVEGTIENISDREVVVNINFKSDGVIPRAELRYNPEVKVGDKIEVYVESQEDQSGQLILSHKKARILKSWERVNEAYEKEEVIKGYVKSRTKGGLIVDVFGIEAFLPGSQIDVKPIRDYDIYVDKVMEFKVVKINQEYKNVVVS
ncbi:MAG: S1 RNA-binding domain-containing protein, partial [Bacteroidales bacterium]